MHDELEYETGLDSMTKGELKAEARARGLPTTGTKAVLLERVEEHDREAGGGDGGGQEAAPAADERAGAEAPSGNGSRDDGQPEPSAEEREGGPEDRGAPEEAEPEPEDREAPEEAQPEPEQAEAEPEQAEPEPEQAEAEPEEAEPEPEQAEAEPEEAEPEPEQAEVEPEEAEPEPELRVAEGGAGETEAPERREQEPTAVADAATQAGAGAPRKQRRRNGRDDGGRIDIADAASIAARALTELTGRTVDAVSGARKTDDGYHVTVEVLELSRVPSTTDVLATYEVGVAFDGSIVDYSRAHRYYRNQTSRE
jgi:Gas vesicle synthesis protein GvpO/SAP domain